MENSVNASALVKETKKPAHIDRSEIPNVKRSHIDVASLIHSTGTHSDQKKSALDKLLQSNKKSANTKRPDKPNYSNKTPTTAIFLIYVYNLKTKKVISEFADFHHCQRSEGSIYNELAAQISKIQSSNYDDTSITPLASVYSELSWAFHVNSFGWAIIGEIISSSQVEVQNRRAFESICDY